MSDKKERKKIYGAWKNMIYRCDNKDDSRYANYGARGITVCEEWYNFDVFYKWCIENGHAMNLGLDRIDNDKGYSSSNCRWATRAEQQSNRRNKISITIDGMTKTALEWCEIYDLNYITFCNRYNTLGWDGVKSITTPVKRKKIKGFVPMEYIDEHRY